ncbi:MAG: aspartate--tRNA ligase [Bacteroidales bacterium]|nr:aspartate--tRNA ligase [Bacteroidales bacterium]
MLRTHNCGELRITDVNKEVILCGWIRRIRDMGSIIWIDLRDRYGITQLTIFKDKASEDLLNIVNSLAREYVIKAKGKVIERESKNPKLATGDIEIQVEEILILNKSEIPPFLIENETNGSEELRLKYRFLDLRRPIMQNYLLMRHRLARYIREYLDNAGFVEIETPMLIRSTPEGARDFLVPSRLHPGKFYALPQSPQLFKQILMIAGFDKYYQLVRCFRDEDLRADRQPEFTQLDCEMSFVEQEDILNTFEGLFKYLFKKELNIDFTNFNILKYTEAIEKYGSDKPDLRYSLEIVNITNIVKGKGFNIFDDADVILGICVPQGNVLTRKHIDELTQFVRRPQIGCGGLAYIRVNSDGSYKSSFDKYYTQEDLNKIAINCNAQKNDIILILSGPKKKTYFAMGELRKHVAEQLNLINKNIFCPVWVIDFPMFEWDEETRRYYAKHHPFTSPKQEDIELLESNPEKVRANAYDLVINGIEIGGGSIRIHDIKLQKLVFKCLGFTEKEINEKFGFLLKAFEYGVPPHGGIAFGFDRICSLFAGVESIRDVIAFPKNQNARDLMIDAPSQVDSDQLNELNIAIKQNF